ncbi:hypothetical protein NLM59_00560 [Weeksellaceae bacterium KMM 9724]|uniref:PSP1 domain-containing protein n=1 Tax=Profundicola chukchiensis TaxID=2961959 RepID=UPI00243B8393|nr:regulatory iron-sulfur-containing complex subunit RicT [Profundicola chukchiensis]MDG4949401.1 hypothetical protein [Profundicola chukchiensis]
MACSGCSTENGLPKGCRNNGACASGSCEKLPVFDWLANMSQPVDILKFPYVEVKFKNDRKEFYYNIDNLPLVVGDVIAVEANPGHDIGRVSLSGELVRSQMKHRKVKPSEALPKIYRKANQKDIDVWQACREKEHQMMLDARRIAREIGLEMKISDVEYQGDGSKATFYYTSETRVDFRQLIREYASAFRCRIEMRQIGFRQEASKLGGIGSCGRELCCSTWLTDFRSVSTSAARYQQLSINPQKIAGQCGKLKCCLNYELDSYLDALKDFPRTDLLLETEKGKAYCVKIDVFKKEVWLAYQDPRLSTWYSFKADKVQKFLAENKAGKPTKSLEDLNQEYNEVASSFNKDIIEENSLQRFETPKSKRRRKRNKNTYSKNKNKSSDKTKTDGTTNAKRKPNKKRYKKTKPKKKGD